MIVRSGRMMILIRTEFFFCFFFDKKEALNPAHITIEEKLNFSRSIEA